MMHWTDSGFVLSARKHGESSAIVNVLTREHGRHAGLVRGGSGRRLRGILQPGNEIAASWRARLSEHLGSYTVELSGGRAGPLLGEADKLAGLASACAIAEALMPERESHPALYAAFRILMASFEHAPDWQAVYVRWELGLLAELGFGLDLSKCAATGVTENLTHVSPCTGRAVCEEAAAPYGGRLLRLPAFLLNGGNGATPGNDAIHDGLALTGHFLENHVGASFHGKLPASRGRFIDRLRG
jgi:DNA repair protein RecO (recombination protein O)